MPITDADLLRLDPSGLTDEEVDEILDPNAIGVPELSSEWEREAVARRGESDGRGGTFGGQLRSRGGSDSFGHRVAPSRLARTPARAGRRPAGDWFQAARSLYYLCRAEIAAGDLPAAKQTLERLRGYTREQAVAPHVVSALDDLLGALIAFDERDCERGIELGLAAVDIAAAGVQKEMYENRIAGFTQIAAGMHPDQLVDVRGQLFGAFDRIMVEHGCERVETIGDAFLAVAGLGVSDERSFGYRVADMIRAEVDVARYLVGHNGEFRAHGAPEFHARIGAHAGSIVGGLVGTERVRYAVFGDAVNIAQRLEAGGRPGNRNGVCGGARCG